MADEASWLAVRADSAVWFTVAVICSIALAVCCSEPEVSSVRWLRSVLAAAISELAPATPTVPVRICCTISVRLTCIWPSARCSAPISSRRVTTSTGTDRSFSAMRCAVSMACRSGRVTDSVMRHAIAAPISSAASASTSTSVCACCERRAASVPSVSVLACTWACSAAMASR